MNCPLDIPENAQVLFDYSTRKLDPERAATLERHIASCPACRDFTTAWEALDTWQAPPVSPDFNRKLYARIEQEVSWWDLLVRPFRPLMVRRGLPAAAAACLLVVAGVLIERPAASPVPKSDVAQIESVQPEQVEQALDTMEMLSEFSHKVRSDGQESKL